MTATLESFGLVPVGPAETVEVGLRLVEREAFDAALVDANLQGHPVHDIVAALHGRGIPFAFVSGYPRASLPKDFQQMLLLSKPWTQAKLRETVVSLLGTDRPAGG